MDISQLKCFISVARTLNFSEAARRNYVSQSTVSRYIIDLEKEFGVQLFIRSHRDVLLTDEGKTLLPYAIEIVDTLAKATSIIKQMHEGGKGRITVACDQTSFSFPTKCIKEFRKRYPDITVDVKSLDCSGNGNVLGGDYDFCFMPRDMLPESSSVESIVTHSEQLFVIVDSTSKLARRKEISLSDLSDKKLVLLSENITPILYMEIMDLYRTFHIAPNVANTFDDVKSMYMAVAAGMGISIVPSSLLNFSSDTSCASIPLTDADTSISYVMAWNKSVANPVSKHFLELVKEYANDVDNIYGL
ncbi:LysR family transcriptional regulator [Ruminococcus sp.]|uniref:LysR family transcriptional regulator n=1 Tax=Ruminococcus sp. TaxID=41978 RepID=UPI003521631E